MYSIVEEASGAVYANIEDLCDAIEEADKMPKTGKYLVVDNKGFVMYDTKPEVTYKI